MAEQKENTIKKSHWLSWCRLCGSYDEIQGNVKIYTIEKECTWNSIFVMAIKKHFDVDFQVENDVLCKKCYALISKLMDFAAHVANVQAFFGVLRFSQPNNQLDVEALRQQYGLSEGNWTHIIELEPDIKNDAVKIVNDAEELEMDEAPCTNKLPEMSPNNENINLLPIEKVRVPSCNARSKQNNPIPSTRRKLTDCKKMKLKSSASADIVQTDLLGCSSTETTEPEIPTLNSQHPKMNKKGHFCDLCDKKLSTRKSLQLHMVCMHENAKPFVCDECGKQLKTKTALKEHKLVHSEERPCICTVCKAGFKSQGRLNRHRQIHDEPSYECDICGKKLQTRDILAKHKYVHTNPRRYKCTVCGTATATSTALKNHLLSHTGFRSFICNYCNKDFACAANVKKHKKKMHPVEYARDGDKSSRVSSVPTLEELRFIAAGMEKTAPLRKPKAMKK